jgi:CheY-like chemotaxis protein/HPt (histidine-containing phosphotransfer) domain-containing protein
MQELVHKVKAEPKLANTAVMLFSDLVKGETDKFTDTGFTACLTKPIRKAQLYRSLQQVLTSDHAVKRQAIEKNTLAPSNPTVTAKILLVEDNAVNQEIVMMMLQKFGCIVTIANNGAEALNKLELDNYNLILMDCMMPIMDGYEATMNIRKMQRNDNIPKLPIIALTANAIEGDREKCLACGMDDYISKPFNADDLLQKLKFWLQAPKLIEYGQLNAQTHEKDTQEIIDESVLAALKNLDANSGEEILRRIIGIYFEHAEKLLHDLISAWDKGDIQSIRIAAHTLKSSSHQVGATVLGELCRIVEQEARENRYDPTRRPLVEIQQLYTETRIVLETYLASMTH